MNSVTPKTKEDRALLTYLIWGAITVAFLGVCFMLYKNISYPLLFNDEAETAMNAKQVLTYGYPKGHDEKNTIFVPDNPEWLGYKPSLDANISIPWGNYYFATIGVFFATFTNDIYTKTALVRIPFATAGLLGLVVFALAFKNFFPNKKQFRLFLLFFFSLEFLSVNLFLNLREARYYSLVVLLSALYFYLVVQRLSTDDKNNKKYRWLMTAVLFVSFNINFLTYLAMCATLGIYELACFIYEQVVTKIAALVEQAKAAHPNAVWTQELVNGAELQEGGKRLLTNLLPVFISGLAVSPLLLFFEVFSTAEKASEYYNYNTTVFSTHLHQIVWALSKHELLFGMILVELLLLCVYLFLRRKKGHLSPVEKRMAQILFFMLLFSVIYVLLVARFPLPIPWMRYYVVLGVIFTIMVLIGVALIFEFVKNSVPARSRALYKSLFLLLVVAAGVVGVYKRENHVGDYLYELFHPYQGPLDEYIPSIMQRYPKTDDLVIATNYEELSYMYYLNSKVILGYNYAFRPVSQDELEKNKPDVLIFRKRWGQDPFAYKYYKQQAMYERVSFPIVDWPVNNLEDLEFFVKHQFKTVVTGDDREKADIFFRQTH